MASKCCALDQSDKNCVNLAYDDKKCEKLYECCGAMHDAGLQAKCLSRVRECRKLGNAWDPIRALKPMNATTMFTDLPGYTTQGQLKENFSGSFAGLQLRCIIKNSVVFAMIGFIFKIILKRSEIGYDRILVLSLLAGLIRCMAECL